ncbi:MAG TPA: hypothetical protein VK835_07350 [Bacteroidia bacterium]|jgi:hypothetical protein|nr:hypothetical protein [Bacteroidia bacterium]
MKFIISYLFIFIAFTSFSQDLIIRLDSSKIFCNILKEDSSTIYFKAKKGDDVVEQSIKKLEVLSYSNSKAIVQKQIKQSDSLSLVKKKSALENDSLVFISRAKFRYKGKIYSAYGLPKIMEENSEEQLDMKKAKNNLYGGLIFATSGGALLGTAMADLVNNQQESAFQLGGFGLGLILIAIPFDFLYKKHSQHAVKLFNSKHKIACLPPVKLGIASKGLGFSLTF